MMERRKKVLIVSGTIVLVLILIIIGIFVMNSRANATNATSTPTPTATVAAQPTPKPISPYAQPLKEYGPGIKNQIAQGLKLTTTQVATRLKAGKSLGDIATAQGLSATQLQNLIATSLQNSFQPAITSGELTQKQVTVLIKRWQKNPKPLVRLLEARSKKVPAPTPGVGATPTP